MQKDRKAVGFVQPFSSFLNSGQVQQATTYATTWSYSKIGFYLNKNMVKRKRKIT